MDLTNAVAQRDRHQPRSPGWLRRRRGRPPKCRACRDLWPCAPNRFARARVLQLVRAVLAEQASGAR